MRKLVEMKVLGCPDSAKKSSYLCSFLNLLVWGIYALDDSCVFLIPDNSRFNCLHINRIPVVAAINFIVNCSLKLVY